MYTTRKSEKARLKAYYQELGEHYRRCVEARQFEEARAIHVLRQRVWAALLRLEEWDADPADSAQDALRLLGDARGTSQALALPERPASAPAAGVLAQDEAEHLFAWLKYLLATGRLVPGVD